MGTVPDAGTLPANATSAAMIDVRAVAAMLDCSTRHVRRLADAGKMPAPVKLGCLIRWRRADIDAWLAVGCRPVRSTGKAG